MKFDHCPSFPHPNTHSQISSREFLYSVRPLALIGEHCSTDGRGGSQTPPVAQVQTVWHQ